MNSAYYHKENVSCLPMFSLSDYSSVNTAVKITAMLFLWQVCAVEFFGGILRCP